MPNAGAFKKGEKRPNQGRPKGKQNVHTTALKDMILGALNKAGGIEYLRRQAEESPGAFLTLVGKVLPLQLAGDPDQPLAVAIVERVIIDPKTAD